MPIVTDEELRRLLRYPTAEEAYARGQQIEAEGFGEVTDEDLIISDAMALNRLSPPIAPPAEFIPQQRGGVLPPGPSPEFLRRSTEMSADPELPYMPPGTVGQGGYGRGAVSSFDPATGQREQFMTVSPPKSRERQIAELMEQQRQQVVGQQFNTQAAAQNAARQFQATRGYQQALESGMDQTTALNIFGAAMFGKDLPKMAETARRSQPPSFGKDPGTGASYVTDAGGTRIIPRSALPSEAFKPQVMEVDGERVIQLGPNRFQVLKEKEVTAKETPPGVRLQIYKRQLEEAKQELESLPGTTFRFGAAAAKIQEQRSAIEQRIKDINSDIDAMVKPKGSSESPKPEAPVTTAAPKDGVFQSEQEARSAGHKAGDIVVLQINGKPTRVRLK